MANQCTSRNPDGSDRCENEALHPMQSCCRHYEKVVGKDEHAQHHRDYYGETHWALQDARLGWAG